MTLRQHYEVAIVMKGQVMKNSVKMSWTRKLKDNIIAP